MSIIPGNWTPFTFSVTPAAAWNGLSAAQANTAVTAIRDAFVAAAGSNGWSADGAAVEYSGGFGFTIAAVISAQHTSGDRILFVVNGGGSAISGLNSDVGSAIAAGAVGLAYNAGGAFSLAANTTNISSSALFTDANQNRFSFLFGSNGFLVSYTFYGAVQGRNVWITGQNSTASASQWSSAVLMGPDVLSALIHTGDTSTQAQIRFGGVTAGTTSNHGETAFVTTPAIPNGVAQVRAADGTTRCAARIFCAPLNAAAQNVASTSWVLNDIWIARDTGDISTTGIVPNSGVKGRVARGAAMLGPQAITNKVRVGPAESMMVHTNNGLCLGWDENAVAGIP